MWEDSYDSSTYGRLRHNDAISRLDPPSYVQLPNVQLPPQGKQILKGSCPKGAYRAPRATFFEFGVPVIGTITVSPWALLALLLAIGGVIYYVADRKSAGMSSLRTPTSSFTTGILQGTDQAPAAVLNSLAQAGVNAMFSSA